MNDFVISIIGHWLDCEPALNHTEVFVYGELTDIPQHELECIGGHSVCVTAQICWVAWCRLAQGVYVNNSKV